MHQLSPHDRQLGQLLRQLSHKFNNRYTIQSSIALTRILFHHLANHNEDYLCLLFPDGPPTSETQPWRLTDAQGAVEGAEYSDSARGRRCGHIFKNGEATYSCRTCTADDTCVLCTRCFEASDHEGHQVYVSMSAGSSGCCDCEDPEAWLRPVKCSIHTQIPEDAMNPDSGRSQPSPLPPDLQESIRATISRALDFVVDVLSCCPEEMRPPKAEASIREDEEKSRLLERYYGGPDQEEREFALVLWNDEKHTVDEVADRVARACRQTNSFGRSKAHEVDEVGRSILTYSRSVSELIRQGQELTQIKVTVTIRSSRDIFREQMCGVIIQWLADIAGCRVGKDHNTLMNVVCEEMLRPWRMGSDAYNLAIASQGITDHQKSDERLDEMVRTRQARLMQLQAQRVQGRRVPRPPMTPNPPQDPPEGAAESGNEDEADADTFEQSALDDEMDLDDDLGDIDVEGDDDGLVTLVGTAAGELLDALQGFPRQISRSRRSAGSEEQLPVYPPETDSTTLFSTIPRTPGQTLSEGVKAPTYWTSRKHVEEDLPTTDSLPTYEDMARRIRIDHLVLYDLRMWKQLRTNLKHLYISTVVAIPEFKRILSLRFASLYAHLAQLYLVADREPDHSIINLSLQMLTTPSITAEVVKRGNFLTRLMAILYTFLTKRQVGNPEDVDLTATISFETGVLTNRRIYHFFSDLRYLLDASFVIERIRLEPEYLLQFLDFTKLYQGICPNVRAIGEHIEYESDAWINASVLVRDVTRLSRQFCDAFKWTKLQDPSSICRAIRQSARIVIVNSLGVEHDRFPQAELKNLTRFKQLEPFLFEVRSGTRGKEHYPHTIVDFDVAKSSMSFHHALHYALSWLIDCGKSMSRDQLQGLLTFNSQQLYSQDLGSAVEIPLHTSQEYLLALFDIPLRVCAWLAQMKAGMWVRNGITLRHQMGTYRGVGQREVSYQRDIFLLQVAFTVCDPATFLASIIERFDMTSWMRGDFRVTDGFEDHQLVDVADEFLHLLVVLLSDRTLLAPFEEDPTPHLSIARRDIIHTLCFKPLTYSELTARLSDRVQELKEFHTILHEVASYRPPEGLSDSGQLQLKEVWRKEIDPYHVYYTKSQREEAEIIFRTNLAQQSGMPKDEVFYLPQLKEIRSGLFVNFATFSQIPLFSQIIFCFMRYIAAADTRTPGISTGRVESLLQTLLHLILLAASEDDSASTATANSRGSFIDSLLFAHVDLDFPGDVTILWQLFMLLKDERFDASKARVRFVLHFLRQKRPESFNAAVAQSGAAGEWEHLMSAPWTKSADDAVVKKQQALERQARVMEAFKKQQNAFMENQPIDWGVADVNDSDDEMEVEDLGAEPETWSFPGGTCIFCQEETKEQQLYGTLAYMTESNIFRQPRLDLDKYVEEVCMVPRDLDRSAEAIRPFGVAGQNLQMITKADATGHTIEIERRGLGEGFPQAESCSGPIVTSCGHVMHYSCFQTYDNATARRHSYQVHRDHPEDIKLKEFVCPLCKALGNAFLPVVWKPKLCNALRILDDSSFGNWLSDASLYFSSSTPHPPKTFEELSMDYVTASFVPLLAGILSSANRIPQETNVETPPVVRAGFRIPAFLRFDHNESTTDSTGPGAPAQPLIISELDKAYQRLYSTMKTNGLAATPHAQDTSLADLGSSEVLAGALGCSIAAVEIAQRGIEASSAATFIDVLPEHTMTSLRVFSETVSSYVALGNLHKRSKISSRNSQLARLQGQQLFGQDTGDSVAAPVTSLFAQDTFNFLAASTVYLVPTFELKLYPILRLCYFAEIVKVVTALLTEPEKLWHGEIQFPTDEEAHITSAQKHEFSSFVEDLLLRLHQIEGQSGHEPHAQWAGANPNARYAYERIIYHMLTKYALTFLRKSALLVSVRFGIKFAALPADDMMANTGTPELLRLTHLLGLPSIIEVVHSYLSKSQEGHLLRERASAWITSWAAANEHVHGQELPRRRLVLSHPTIYELVSLPQAHDTLNAETTTRRCPSTGGDLNDPSICLFCGTFVCSQTRCCTRENPRTGKTEGGCLRHSKECAGNIGMFFNIRKCVVICFHRDRGSFFTAPYLDKHGEVDLGLRRKNQLFLNQKRYDRIFRDMWLKHDVPSAVARKLEAEINTGGWETI